jgi:hypothetical protein
VDSCSKFGVVGSEFDKGEPKLAMEDTTFDTVGSVRDINSLLGIEKLNI